MQETIHPYGENFIPMGDELLHTADQPFCFDPTCSCHKNDQLRNAFANQVYEYILDGTLAAFEGELLLEGRTV
ncbi:MAG: hypothetical protein ACRDIV_14835 [Ktedonobacteraceae bacterium]